jgi:hypothetical protein
LQILKLRCSILPILKTKINQNPSSGLEKLYARGVEWIEEWNSEGFDMMDRVYRERRRRDISTVLHCFGISVWNLYLCTSRPKDQAWVKSRKICITLPLPVKAEYLIGGLAFRTRDLTRIFPDIEQFNLVK